MTMVKTREPGVQHRRGSQCAYSVDYLAFSLTEWRSSPLRLSRISCAIKCALAGFQTLTPNQRRLLDTAWGRL